MLKGFHSEVFDSQAVFRNLLSAAAYPGTILPAGADLICPTGLHPAAGAVLLALLDPDTPLCSDRENASDMIQWLRFHTGAPYTRQKRLSLFALITDCLALEDPAAFNTGSLVSPDQSTTLIIQTRGMDDSGTIRLSGPGIEKSRFLKLAGVPVDFLKKRAELFRTYPLGIDMIFVWEEMLMALPRTIRAEVI